MIFYRLKWNGLLEYIKLQFIHWSRPLLTRIKSICKHLVALMGGTISVESEEKEGTTVHFCIPFKKVTQAADSTTDDLDTSRTSSLKVLVADDDNFSRMATRLFMKKLGNQAVAVEDGEKALSALKKEHFDLVLMDVQMPVLNGAKTAQAIRSGEAGEENKAIPIIALTAFAMAGDKENLLKAGMNGYVSKPFAIDELQKEVNRVFEDKDS